MKTAIQVDVKTREELKKIKIVVKESYNEIIIRLLEEHNKK